MNEQAYNVTYVELGEDYIDHLPLVQKVSAKSNSKARQEFKEMMRDITFSTEHEDYEIISVQLASVPLTLDLIATRKGLTLKDANRALKHLKKGGDVQIEAKKELQNIHLVPDSEADNAMRLSVIEVWDDTIQIANVIKEMGGNIDPERDVEELDDILFNHGVDDAFYMSWLYDIPDDGKQLNEIILYAIEDFNRENKRIFNAVLDHFKK